MRLHLLAVTMLGLMGASQSGAQDIISAQSGLIHYVEGKVYMGTEQVRVKVGQYPTLKEKAELRTELGRAEVLLTPGAILRIGEESAIRMIDPRLTNTQVELLSGSMLVESDDLLGDKQDNRITLVLNGVRIAPQKSGLYRIDSEPAQLRVYEGEAEVDTGSNVITVKKGRLLPLTGAMVAEKFDVKVGDPLTRWAARRAESLAMANVSAAKRARDLGYSWSSGRWAFNPYFGMLTYLPASGIWNSPYGFRYYSPGLVYRVYEVPVFRGPSSLDTGWGGPPTMIGRTSSGYGGSAHSSAGAAPSMPSTTAASAPSAPVTRSEGRAGGGGR
jgi:hypothetical protein